MFETKYLARWSLTEERLAGVCSVDGATAVVSVALTIEGARFPDANKLRPVWQHILDTKPMTAEEFFDAMNCWLVASPWFNLSTSLAIHWKTSTHGEIALELL